MPHKCTNCEQIFDDGSAAILNGCPNCGWHKFLYVPAKPATDAVEATDTETEPGEPEMEKTAEAASDMEVESIRILEKGSYELNLKSLLDREEIIMSVKEDGRYLVHLPSVFEKSRKGK
jgi:predicted  nucleic acid-binding Zn-ribbon protein